MKYSVRRRIDMALLVGLCGTCAAIVFFLIRALVLGQSQSALIGFGVALIVLPPLLLARFVLDKVAERDLAKRIASLPNFSISTAWIAGSDDAIAVSPGSQQVALTTREYVEDGSKLRILDCANIMNCTLEINTKYSRTEYTKSGSKGEYTIAGGLIGGLGGAVIGAAVDSNLSPSSESKGVYEETVVKSCKLILKLKDGEVIEAIDLGLVAGASGCRIETFKSRKPYKRATTIVSKINETLSGGRSYRKVWR